jgi:hypothetical protein
MLLARTLLTAIFLTLFSQTAWAADVYLCKIFEEVEVDLRFDSLQVYRDKKEKNVYPTITDYHFQIVKLYINGKDTLIIGDRSFQFVGDKKSRIRSYYENIKDGKTGFNRVTFDSPEELTNKVDRLLTEIVDEGQRPIFRKSNCIGLKKCAENFPCS